MLFFLNSFLWEQCKHTVTDSPVGTFETPTLGVGMCPGAFVTRTFRAGRHSGAFVWAPKKDRNLRDFKVFGTAQSYIRFYKGEGGFDEILRVLTMAGGGPKFRKKNLRYY